MSCFAIPRAIALSPISTPISTSSSRNSSLRFLPCTDIVVFALAYAGVTRRSRRLHGEAGGGVAAPTIEQFPRELTCSGRTGNHSCCGSVALCDVTLPARGVSDLFGSCGVDSELGAEHSRVCGMLWVRAGSFGGGVLLGSHRGWRVAWISPCLDIAEYPGCGRSRECWRFDFGGSR